MPEDTYIVYTDASYMGIGGVLRVSRKDRNCQLHSFQDSFVLVKRIIHHQKLNVWQWLTQLDSLKFTWWESHSLL